MKEDASKIIKLRPHHMWGCVLVWDNKSGYSSEHIVYFNDIVKRLNQGPITVEITLGPDTACAFFNHCDPKTYDRYFHCDRADVLARDVRSLAEMNEWLAKTPWADRFSLPLKEGQRVELSDELVAAFREGFRQNATRSGCTGCIWSDRPKAPGKCTEIAAAGFSRSVFQRGRDSGASQFVIL